MKPVDEAEDIFRVLTTDLLETDYEKLIRRLEIRAAQPGTLAVDFSDTQFVTMRQRDSAFAGLTNCFDMFVPGSMPLVWVMKRLGSDMKDPIAGSILMRRLLSQSSPEFRHYFIGENEECINRLRARMLKQNPDIDLVGCFHGICSAAGYLQPPEVHDSILEDLRAKEPHFIWVGLGTPKQYAFIANLKRHLRSGILLSMGFAFDVNAGIKRDAPLFMQRHRLTWLYRLATEPKRLLGQYAKFNSLFLLYLLRSHGK